MSSKTAPTTKTFGKSTRSVPHHSEKAQKWYPAEADAQPRKVRRWNENLLELGFWDLYPPERRGKMNWTAFPVEGLLGTARATRAALWVGQQIAAREIHMLDGRRDSNGFLEARG